MPIAEIECPAPVSNTEDQSLPTVSKPLVDFQRYSPPPYKPLAIVSSCTTGAMNNGSGSGGVMSLQWRPPSLPTHTVPSAIAAACWSECVVFGQPPKSDASWSKHFSVRFQYGAAVTQLLPASVLS